MDTWQYAGRPGRLAADDGAPQGDRSATEIEAAELLTFQAGDMKNRGVKMTKESAFAKYYASEVCVRVATDAIQIFGGYGYTKEFPVERFAATEVAARKLIEAIR